MAIYGNMFCSNKITRNCQTNVLVQNIEINNISYIERRKKKNCSSYRGYKLFLSEDWFEAMKVNCSIASISILLSSENILFGAKTSRIELDNKIELWKVFGSLYLSPGQHLGSRKILNIIIIHNNIYSKDWTF